MRKKTRVIFLVAYNSNVLGREWEDIRIIFSFLENGKHIHIDENLPTDYFYFINFRHCFIVYLCYCFIFQLAELRKQNLDIIK
jgi:hypothetical protein